MEQNVNKNSLIHRFQIDLIEYVTSQNQLPIGCLLITATKFSRSGKTNNFLLSTFRFPCKLKHGEKKIVNKEKDIFSFYLKVILQEFKHVRKAFAQWLRLTKSLSELESFYCVEAIMKSPDNLC